jgi:tetratricopeptide (TPR) repeat protein
MVSQNTTIDSLETQLLNYKTNDTLRVNLLNELALSYYQERKYEKAILYFKNSIAINESIGNIKNTALSLKYLGYVYSDLDNYDEAFKFFTRALKINIEYKNDKETASCLNNMGILFGDQFNFPLALKYYNESLEISEKIKDSVAISKALNNMGTIYSKNENYEKAIEKYEKSFLIQKKSGNKNLAAGLLNNLGNIHKKMGNYTIALNYLNEALKMGSETNDKYLISTSLNNIGDTYLSIGNNELAYKNFSDGMDIKMEINDQFGLCRSYVGIAYTLVNEKRYNEALIYTLKGKYLSEKLQIQGLQINVYELLSKIYSETGNFKKAFECNQLFKSLNDSLFNKENIEKIAQIEYEYKYKQQLDSASIRELKLTRTVMATSQDLEKSQRNYLLVIIGFLLVSILLGSIIFYQKFRNIKSKNQTIVTEQKLLRSQMTPHFIFNSLSVLQGMILNKEEKKSVDFLSKFSKLLRIIIENSRDKTVLLSQELEAIENYLSLQNLENESYQYTILVDDAIDQFTIEIPPMLIQPFVENTIEHAFENQIDKKKIDVHLSYIDKKIVCTITDNGIGIDSSKENRNKNKKSLATTITSERLKILSKDFKMEGTVTLEDRQKYNEQGTKVTLVIPHKKTTV